MQTRDFGRLGRISALTLGGGGIGAVWGDTDRAEATATVHAAIDAGITMMDLAPSYGDDHEAERVAGEALRAKPAPEVMITSKVQLPDDEQRDFAARIRRSLHASLRRLGRTHLDLFLLHTHLRPRDAAAPNPPDNISWEHYRGEVVVEFERLRDEGLIRAWGITAVGYPATVLDALRDTPRPDAAQVIVNALDLTGDLWPFDPQPPANEDIAGMASQNGVAVSAIRVVAAGSLTAGLDRPIPADHPAALDYVRAEPFRKLAAELGETPAALAHRYALTVPGVATVVLGVKNRAELAECVAAEARGPLTTEELRAIRALR
ncbi:aldo/keto reductase [Amorphoplanes digitatis]|uniref:Aryl-alcohol dehydrogenase-like predicted oxidoreductase n=1 Tax=Actinoplanes digitatis TaxID=1868 RepID=A0A7W7HVL4_9ACTN|nr:aldo/keto reductase [Actinoplanes digitatis]MBB4761523.1 aryl-alcohol dehydrogenase-like predicted oxidoreductase [Actinoplanes digitatis]GID90632.1 oxidoreductase [Actinoplanes digitatis]